QIQQQVTIHCEYPGGFRNQGCNLDIVSQILQAGKTDYAPKIITWKRIGNIYTRMHRNCPARHAFFDCPLLKVMKRIIRNIHTKRLNSQLCKSDSISSATTAKIQNGAPHLDANAGDVIG